MILLRHPNKYIDDPHACYRLHRTWHCEHSLRVEAAIPLRFIWTLLSSMNIGSIIGSEEAR